MSLSALAGDMAGTGIQSTTASDNQFQIGILYSAVREVNVNLSYFSHINSSFGPINNYVVAFSGVWPTAPGNESTYAYNKNPWLLPGNNSLEDAVGEMFLYFAENFSKDPQQIAPDFFEDLRFTRYSNPLTISRLNLWKRSFDIKYLSRNNE